MAAAGARRRAGPPDADVHVWWTLDVLRFAALGTHLDRDERQRAARLRRPVDRQRLTARRGLLRTVLAGYLDVDPATLRFAYGHCGKPSLEQSEHDLEFNVAHSGNAAMLAVGSGRPIGVDLERVRSDIDAAALVGTACTPRERAALTALPAARVRAAFCTLWVHKEAVAKGDGRGLSLAPTGIEVGSALGNGLARVVVAEDLRPAIWWTRTLSVAPGFVAAIASLDSNEHITLRQISTVDDMRSLLRAI